MPRYRNTRTGQTVERRHRDARLDGLAVWERLDEPEPEPADEPEHDVDDQADEPEPVPASDADPPARSASRGAWAGYARSRGVDPDGMTKAALIDALD